MKTVRAGLLRRVVLVGTVTVTAAACLPATTQAQGLRIGALAGANFSELRGAEDFERRTGLMGGVQLIVPFGLFSLQTEGLLVSAGAQPKVGSGDGVRINYAQLPVLFRLSPASGAPIAPHVYAGPYFGFRVSCKVDIGGTDGGCDEFDEINDNTVDVGGVLGGGLDFDLGGVILTGGARYNFGISKVAEFQSGSIRESAKNGSFSIYAGLSIRLAGR